MHTRRVFHLTGAIALACLTLQVFSLAAIAQTDIAQLQSRRNVGLFFDKLRDGREVNVAFLGGTVSAGPSGQEAGKGLRASTLSWLRAQYPRQKINELNATVRGTGSAYGAIRVRRDVVEHKPDLAIVEFAYDDARETDDDIQRSIEGIIRQLLAVSEPPEIIILCIPRDGDQRVPKLHDQIAGFYRIPAVTVMEGSGAKPADALIQYLDSVSKLQASPPVRILPGYFVSDEMTYGESKAFAEIAYGNSWKLESTTERSLPSSLVVSSKAEATLEIVFEGTVAGISFRTGPDGGLLECLIDGKPAPGVLANIDTYSKEAGIATRILTGGLSAGEHKLTVKVTGKKNPASSGNTIRLGSLLIGGSRPERL